MALPAPARRRPHPERRRPKRVLVVEDHADIALLLRIVLEWSGHAVDVAGDLRTARTRLASSLPDVVLLDMQLPDGDGVELCREIKAASPRLPVLVVSASPDRRSAAEACGADDFVPKPFEPGHLDALVRRLLGGTWVERRTG